MKILINKTKKTLDIIDNDEVIETYPIGIGAKEGHKQIEGDYKTPEGDYEILVKNPKSDHHLSLGISYPNKKDALEGLNRGDISEIEYEKICNLLDSGKGTLWNTKLGGKIYIHGGLEVTNGSQGCVCLNNPDIEKLFDMVDVGTKVKIIP